METERAFDGDLPIAERFVRKYLRLFRFFERKKCVADASDIVIRKFAVLLAEVFPQRLEPLRCVDELHLPFAVLRLCGW